MSAKEELTKKIERALSDENASCLDVFKKLSSELVYDALPYHDHAVILLDVLRADIQGFTGIYTAKIVMVSIHHVENEDGTVAPREFCFNGEQLTSARELAEKITEFVNV